MAEESVPTAKRPRLAAPSLLRVLSFNTYLRPPLVTCTGLASDDFKAERLAGIIEELPRFDLVGLQEVYSAGSWRQHELIEKAAARGFAYAAHTRERNVLRHGAIDGGLVLLSRTPILAQREMYFTRGTHRDWFCDKGALFARVSLGTGDGGREYAINVVLTHTQASYVACPGPEEVGAKVRAEQLRLLVDFIAQCDPAGEGVLLLGDLNVNARAAPDDASSSWEYKSLEAMFDAAGYVPHDVLLKAHKGQHPVTFGDPRERVISDPEDRGHNARLDYIFYLVRKDAPTGARTTQLRPRLDKVAVEEMAVAHPVEGGPTHLSDHFGVSAVFEVV